jgi:hypothetical protein
MWGLDTQARQAGADLVSVRVSVVERLGDDDAGSDLQGPVVDDDHAFRVDRLGQEPLPQLPGLLRPGRELVEIGVVGTIHQAGAPPASRRRYRLSERTRWLKVARMLP